MIRRTDSFRRRLVACLLPALRLMSPKAANRLLDCLGAAGLALNVVRRARVSSLLGRTAAALESDWIASHAALGWAGKSLRWHARDLLLDRLDNQACDALIHVEGQAHLDRAVAEGRGVVLLFNHFGPFLIHTQWLTRHGYNLRWFTERPRRLSPMVARTFNTDGPLGQRDFFINRRLSPEQGASALRRAFQMLREGMIVQAAGDVRWRGARCVKCRFLGGEHTFTTSWVTLAARTGAPVVPTFARMNLDGTYSVSFLEPEYLDARASEPEAARMHVQRNLDRLEDAIRRDPTNCGDYLYWTDSVASRRPDARPVHLASTAQLG